MELACLDLEGVLVPEIWIAFAERTGIESLRATTRDIPDYNVLMKQRLAILDQHNLKIGDIQEVIATLQPLPGAIEFVDWLRERFQVTPSASGFDIRHIVDNAIAPGSPAPLLDPPPGVRETWLDKVRSKYTFVVLVFYRGLW